MRRIAHVDMDAFFAAIEEQRHPELRGRPLVIGGHGDPTERGVVSTASYAARKYGIHSAMPLRTAYKRCPHAVFKAVDYETYEAVSRQVMAILHGFSPVVEESGIDEAFLDLTDVSGAAETIARAIKERIREATGLTCSVGAAPNKLLAKIASDMEKPDGLTILGEADLTDRVWPLPARELPGVGPKTEAALGAMGVHSIGELAAMPVEVLVARFGEAHGHDLHEGAWGIDEAPLITAWRPHSFSREETFQQDVSGRDVVVRTLARLARETAAEAAAQGYRGRTVTTKLRFADFETLTRQATLRRATSAAAPVARAALQCLDRIALTKNVRLVGVRLSGLERARRR